MRRSLIAGGGGLVAGLAAAGTAAFLAWPSATALPCYTPASANNLVCYGKQPGTGSLYLPPLPPSGDIWGASVSTATWKPRLFRNPR